MLQNQLPGKACDTRDRRSTSAIMRNMTKPRYASMATLRAAAAWVGMAGFASRKGSLTDDSSTGGKSHLPKKFRLAGCGKTRGQTDLSTAWTHNLLIQHSRWGTDSSVPVFFRSLLEVIISDQLARMSSIP